MADRYRNLIRPLVQVQEDVKYAECARILNSIERVLHSISEGAVKKITVDNMIKEFSNLFGSTLPTAPIYGLVVEVVADLTKLNNSSDLIRHLARANGVSTVSILIILGCIKEKLPFLNDENRKFSVHAMIFEAFGHQLESTIHTDPMYASSEQIVASFKELVSFLGQMVSREDWNARAPIRTQSMDMPVSHIFIHHTVTATSSSCSGTMRSIQNNHMDIRGWDDIGYNFVIGEDGRVYIGRGWNRTGAHTLGFNTKSVAFAFMGNYANTAPPLVMLQTAEKLIRYAIDRDYVTRDCKIHGHRDVGRTECPGQSLYDIIRTWNNFEAGPL